MKSSNRYAKPFIITIIFFAAVIVLLITLYRKEKLSAASTKKDRELILKNLGEIRGRYDEVVANSDSLSKQLEVAIEKSKTATDSLGVVKQELVKVEEMKQRIETLKKEEKRLSDLSNYLVKSNRLLDKERDSIKSLYETEKSIKDSILPTYKKLTQYYTEDSQSVAAGTVTNVHVEAYNNNNSITTRSNKVSKIKVCYTVLKTHRLKEGKIKFFIKISSPKNKVLGIGDSVSNKVTGTTIVYSATSGFDYVMKGGIDVCTFVDNLTGLSKGSYTIEVFDHNLYSIGKTTVFME